MTNHVIPLQDLAQRISQQQAALEKLRHEYEARQGQLTKLLRHKAELQAQLKQVETEISGLGLGNKHVAGPMAKPAAPVKHVPAKAVSPKPVPPKVAPSKPGKTMGERPSLPRLLVQIVAKAKRPMTVKDLTTEVVRHKYSTKSSNLSNMIDTRVHELVKKGILRRAKDQPGVLLAKASENSKAPAAIPKPSMPASSSKPATFPKAVSAKPISAIDGLPLPAVVEKVLASSTRPMSAHELAKKVLATGYKTKSKDFTNVIWAGVGKMNNVENVSGQGYRLKGKK